MPNEMYAFAVPGNTRDPSPAVANPEGADEDVVMSEVKLPVASDKALAPRSTGAYVV
jgi:hypothetical protein